MIKAEVIAFHGWGFDASCWDGWNRLLGNEVTLHRAERGYFGDARKTPIFSSKEMPKIIMAHSFGLHCCSPSLIREADMIVIFGGFIQFHPVAAQYKRRSRLVLNQMMNRVQGSPEKVLSDFYENSFHPNNPWEIPDGSYDTGHLLEDLERLDASVLEIAHLKSVDKICILHGFDDAIVPRRKGRELYDTFQKQARYLEVKRAGHALPFTHSEQCWKFIKPELQEIRN
ncbi:MAG: alpha/beta hydrolase [Balneolaceae bacterium]|nr:alpha/beta hydrolase [Balneolaceae bacterium]